MLRLTYFLALTGFVWGQVRPPAFEVATIKRSDMKAESGEMLRDPRIVSLAHVSLQNLLAQAYLIRNYQISGPDWLDVDRFDIVAKLPDDATRNQLPAMLQALLKERFHLAVHQEQRTMTAYVLTPEKAGVKLKAVDTEISGVQTSKGVHSLLSGKLTMTYFAGLLSNMTERPVIDMTALKGVYDIDLEWAADEAVTDSTPSLSTALREKLGLHIESRKAPVDFYVIDRVDRTPTDN